MGVKRGRDGRLCGLVCLIAYKYVGASDENQRGDASSRLVVRPEFRVQGHLQEMPITWVGMILVAAGSRREAKRLFSGAHAHHFTCMVSAPKAA